MPLLSDDLLAALPRLRRYARVLTDDPDRADDIVKEALTRARHRKRESPSAATAVIRLFSILRSVYVEQFAPGRPRGSVSTLHAWESKPLAGVDSNGDAPESNPTTGNELLARLMRLPLEDREVLVLVAVERMSYEDVAMLLAVPLATVLARLTQAREAVRSGAVDVVMAPRSAR